MESGLDRDLITFSFGKNWESFLKTISEDSIAAATEDIEKWLGPNSVKGRTVVDIGCGSGIHSLVFYLKGARAVMSFDVDVHSISATRSVWEQAGGPINWKVQHGSIMDGAFVESLGKYDIVYSWGVLHHTGSMWAAIEKSLELVKHGGLYWIAIYKKGPNYHKHLAQKTAYNKASELGKKFMVYRIVALKLLSRLIRLQNPLAYFHTKRRGMNAYHNLIDWLGGLPYEVASDEEVVSFCQHRGFRLERLKVRREGSNNIYLFSLP